MGGSTYTNDAYRDRADAKAASGTPTFDYHAGIASGTRAAKVHDKMNPRGVERESRDSDEHPITVPIAVFMDTTGSMFQVPAILQGALPKLMGTFLNDKASGKPYLGDGYPAILIGAVDDYNAQINRGFPREASGTLQVGQFESGIEIDEDLSRLWLTRNGGGTYEESYDLVLHFMARHTVHDHWEKRGRKGYLFIIGDEMGYPVVKPAQAEDVIGDPLQAEISFEAILAEAQERYHVFFVIPNMTQNSRDPRLNEWWVERLGQQNVLKLEDPTAICELLASAVAVSEEHVGIDDLVADGLSGSVTDALVPLSKLTAGSSLASHPSDALPAVAGETAETGVDRL